MLQLLIGIKDTNDHLVSITLIALSDLVPILGAATVIGGKRGKLFNDGRPTTHATRKSLKRSSRRNSTLQETSIDVPSLASNSNSSDLYLNQMLELPERPSPDGGEEEISTTEQDQSVEDDLENWSDWDNDLNNQNVVQTANEILEYIEEVQNESESLETTNSITEITEFTTNNIMNLSVSNIPTTVNISKLPDISELDIKNQKNNLQNEKTDEFDFFQDMEPVIEMSKVVLIENNIENGKKNSDEGISLTVSMINDHHDVEEGWGDDLDWVAN